MGLYATAASILAAMLPNRHAVDPLPLIDDGRVPRITAGFYDVGGPQTVPGEQAFLSNRTFLVRNRRGVPEKLLQGCCAALVPEGTTDAIEIRPAGDGRLHLRLPTRDMVAIPSLPPLNGPLYISHRGSHYLNPPNINPFGLYPANTLGAFESALESGYAGFEADVLVTRDNHFVVSHDANLRASTSSRGNLRALTLEELRDVGVVGTAPIPERRLGLIRSPFRAPMPSLQETLDRFLPDPRARVLVIDVKPDHADRIAAAAARLFPRYSPLLRSKLLFLCEIPDALHRLRRIVPEARFALEGRKGWEPLNDSASFLPESSGSARGAHDIVSLNLSAPLMRPGRRVEGVRRFLGSARAFGYGVVGWTLTMPRELQLLFRKGLLPDLILSDAPFCRLALEQLRFTRARAMLYGVPRRLSG